MTLPACPEKHVLCDYCLGKLPPHVMDQVESHLGRCPNCRALVTTLEKKSDTLIARLRQPAAPDGFRQEPKLQEALAAARALPGQAKSPPAAARNAPAAAAAGKRPASPSAAAQPTAAADAFDPYYEWLGIPPADQPPNHYRLLGIAQFEPNDKVIDNAAFRQIAHVRTFALGPHQKESQQLLNELNAARVCLLNSEKRAAYDKQLRDQLAASAAAPPAAPQSAAAPATGPEADDEAWQDGRQPETVDDFVRCVAASGLIEPDDLTAFVRTLPQASKPTDAKSLAMALVSANRLTRYQAKVLYQGHPASLVLGDLELLEPIGSGGSGQVFLAKHRRLDRTEAVKLLSPQHLDSPDAVARFEQEAKAAARLSHENIVTTYDAGQHDGIFYLAMEYVDGSDLAQVVRQQGPLPIGQAVDCVLQSARGLQVAHAAGIVHRDIKPHNLLLDGRGRVKILDLGLARFHDTEELKAAQAALTHSGQIMGTLDYMSPEQAIDTHTADARADIYSLGCTLHFLLTGLAPFAGDSPAQKLFAHRDDPIPSLRQIRSEIPPAVDAVFQKMLAKNPAERYQTMAEVIDALSVAAQSQSPVLAAPRKRYGEDSKLDVFLSQMAVSVELPANRAARPAAKPARRPTRRRPTVRFPNIPLKAVIAGLAGFAAVILLGVIVLSFRTPMGDLTVHIDEGVADSVKVALNNGGEDVVVSKDDEWSVRLKEGTWEVSVSSDDHSAAVKDKTVEILRGKTAVVTVVLVNRGLVAEYFNGRDFKDKVKQRIDPQINFHWGEKSPDQDVRSDNFSVRWTGWLKAPVAGTYRLRVWADDWAGLWLDDKPVIDPDRGEAETDIELDQTPHRLRVDFSEGPTWAGIYFTWTLLGTSTEHVVPAEALFQDQASANAASVDASVLIRRRARSAPNTRPGEPIDLLALIDTAGHAVRGQWWFDGKALMCSWASPALLQIPYTPPAEYDVTMVAQRLDQKEGLTLGLCAGGRQFGVTVDGWGGKLSGIEIFHGTSARKTEGEPRQVGALVSADRPSTLKYTIRRSKLMLTCDGRQVINWDKAEYERCSLREEHVVPGRRHMFLGGFSTLFRISKLELTPRTTESQPFRADLPKKPENVLTRPAKLRPGDWTDLLPYVDIASDQVRGDWYATETGLLAEYGAAQRLMLPVVVKGSYDLEVEFTRRTGNNDVSFWLPIADTHCNLLLSGWNGAASGIRGIGGHDRVDEATAVRPGTIVNGHRYRLVATVRSEGDDGRVDVAMDGKPFLSWTGKHQTLTVPHWWSLPELHRPAVGAHEASVCYHAFRLRLNSGVGYMLAQDRRNLEPYRLTPEAGGGGGGRFYDFAPDGTWLVGLRCSAGNVVHSVQALYGSGGSGGSVREGRQHSVPREQAIETIAKEGYAVGGVEVRKDVVVHGLRTIFMRIRGDTLDPNDRYEGEWIGTTTGSEHLLGCTGEPIVGIYGAALTELDSLGLILPRTSDTTTTVEEGGDILLTALKPFRVSPFHLIVKRSAADGWRLVYSDPYLPRNLRFCNEFVYAHAPSRVGYAVPEGMKSFTAVGYCVKSTHVSYRIVVDEKTIFESPRAAVVPIRIDLPPMSKTLVLVADDLGNYDSDQVYWLFPRFHPVKIAANPELHGESDHVKCVGLPLVMDEAFGPVVINQWTQRTRPVDVVSDEPCDEFLFSHAPARLTYEIPPKVTSFSAVAYNVKSATTRFVVFVDDEPAFASPVAGVAPIRIPIPAGARKLDLIVDPVGDNTSDWAFWCYPRFHRGTPDETSPETKPHAVQIPAPVTVRGIEATVPDVSLRQKDFAAKKNLPLAITNTVGMEMRLIPPGEFVFGPKATDRTRIPEASYVGCTEVTQGQYRSVTGKNPSHHKVDGDAAASDRLPVDTVSWLDAVEFCNNLSEKEKLPAYYRLENGTAQVVGRNGYRLVGETEFNYVAYEAYVPKWQKLTEQDWDRLAWFGLNSKHRTHCVAEKTPNAFGLYDTLGNVWEFVGTPGSFVGRPFHAPADHMAAPGGVNNGLAFRHVDVGFRIARDVPSQSELDAHKRTSEADAKRRHAGIVRSITIGTGAKPDKTLVNPATVFSEGFDNFHYLIQVDPTAETNLRVSVYAVQTDEWNDKLLFQKNNPVTQETKEVYFTLGRNAGWPKGTYRVEAAIDDRVVATQEYSVAITDEHGTTQPGGVQGKSPLEPIPLNPAVFGLPRTAREVVEKRTEKGVVFEVERGKYAAVRLGKAMFRQNERGQWVRIIEEKSPPANPKVDPPAKPKPPTPQDVPKREKIPGTDPASPKVPERPKAEPEVQSLDATELSIEGMSHVSTTRRGFEVMRDLSKHPRDIGNGLTLPVPRVGEKESRNAIWMHAPAYATIDLSPVYRSARIPTAFKAHLHMPPDREAFSDGVVWSLEVYRDRRWEALRTTGLTKATERVELDLPPKSMGIRIVSHPGPANNESSDWSIVLDPEIVTRPRDK